MKEHMNIHCNLYDSITTQYCWPPHLIKKGMHLEITCKFTNLENQLGFLPKNKIFSSTTLGQFLAYCVCLIMHLSTASYAPKCKKFDKLD